jgi:hypothetical protein
MTGSRRLGLLFWNPHVWLWCWPNDVVEIRLVAAVKRRVISNQRLLNLSGESGLSRCSHLAIDLSLGVPQQPAI